MLNAMLNVIVTENLYDKQYVQTYVPRASRPSPEHVRDFTPEEMAPICGIDADTLREVARTFARAENARSSSGAWAYRSTPTAPTTRAA